MSRRLPRMRRPGLSPGTDAACFCECFERAASAPSQKRVTVLGVAAFAAAFVVCFVAAMRRGILRRIERVSQIVASSHVASCRFTSRNGSLRERTNFPRIVRWQKKSCDTAWLVRPGNSGSFVRGPRSKFDFCLRAVCTRFDSTASKSTIGGSGDIQQLQTMRLSQESASTTPLERARVGDFGLTSINGAGCANRIARRIGTGRGHGRSRNGGRDSCTPGGSRGQGSLRSLVWPQHATLRSLATR